MRLRLLFTFGLLLCLSKFGSSNECARCRHAAGEKTTQLAPAATTGDAEYSTLLIPKLLYI
jgi:hypothetical protein